MIAVACIVIAISYESDDSSAYVNETFASEDNVYQYKVLTESGDTGTVSIKAYTSYDNATTNLVLPSSVEHSSKTYTVVAITQAGFQNKTNLESVTLPESVTKIESSGFSGCSHLSSINLANVTDYRDYAFSGCSSLSGIVLSESTTYVGNNAFYNTAITTLTLPASISRLGQRIVGGCNSLTDFYYNCTNASQISSNTPILSDMCMNNVTVHIGNNVQSIPAYAFYKLGANIYLDDGSVLESISNNAFASDSTAANKSTIHFDLPETVTSIGNNAFPE